MDKHRARRVWRRAVDWLGARKPIEIIALMTLPVALILPLLEWIAS